MPNVTAALSNIGGALCSTPQSLVDAHSNAANVEERKTWTQSEFCTWQNSVKAKFHYAIWSQTGSKLVADTSEAKFHCAISSQTGLKLVTDLQRAEL